jgi:PAS domain-containing protein
MELDEIYRLMRLGHVQAQGIVDTVHDPLLVLDEHQVVVTANLSFFETFQVTREETVGANFFELGNGAWNIESLRLLIDKVIPRSSIVEAFEVEGDFPAIGQRTMLVSAKRLVRSDTTGACY